MGRTPTMMVKLRSLLSKFSIGSARNLAHKATKRSEEAAFERLKAELTQAFAAADSSYKPMTAADIIQRFQTKENGNR